MPRDDEVEGVGAMWECVTQVMVASSSLEVLARCVRVRVCPVCPSLRQVSIALPQVFSDDPTTAGVQNIPLAIPYLICID